MKTDNPADLVLLAADIHKSYELGPETLPILQGVNLQIVAGDKVAIMGSSGSGKSTLLNILGALDTADTGEIAIASESVTALNESQKASLRNRHLGFVFQFHHLLPEFSALENVAMTRWLRGDSNKKAYTVAAEILARVGLANRIQHKPAELSGGERQRVAIARAMVGKPKLLLMDEPTGNLDRQHAEKVLELLEELHSETQTSLVVVTHDPNIAQTMDRQLQLVDGQLHAM